MLTNDELSTGMPFILTLRDVAGAAVHWLETLRGDASRHWYEIYRQSDWKALRAEGPAVFRHRATDAEVAHARSYGHRCVVINVSVHSTGMCSV